MRTLVAVFELIYLVLKLSFMRLVPMNKLKLFKVTVLLSITYFLCSLSKKTLSTVVLLLVLKFRFCSVNYTQFSGPTLKRF